MNTDPPKGKPIWLSDEEAAMDFDVLVEHIRSEISTSRGKLRDVARMFRGWHERVEQADGGLTAGT